MEKIEIIVSGKVQGVGFRCGAKKRAEELNLECDAENLENGDVYIKAVGEKDKLQQLVDWCKEGSTSSVVENIQIVNG